MKKPLFSCLILIAVYCNSVYAQNEHNVWYFGNGAGLDFNSGAPVALTDGALYTVEGCASICDAAGNILFYTDGRTVYNSAHAPMPNGFGLGGGISSSQSAIIVPFPASTTQYYIFTVPDQGVGTGLQYSIVDMNLQGGLGDVTAVNVPVFAPTTEQLTATRHSNGTDYWIVTHENLTDAFYAFQLTPAGINPVPVISNVGVFHSDPIGYIKFSHDGQMAATTITYLDQVVLFDFDNSTGILSNPLVFPSVYAQPYGIEFSPDNSRLYFAESGNGGGTDSLYQFDLLAGSPAAILASGMVVGGSPNPYLGPLTLGPDLKIYVARYNTGYVGVINDPDALGMACNYVDTAVYLAGKICQFGLPNFVSNVTPPMPIAIFNAPHHLCPGTCTDFTNLSQHATTYQWVFPGSSQGTSTDVNPAGICYNTPGQYHVTLIASNSVGSDTLTLTNFITVYPYSPPQSILQNGDTLFSNTGFVTYQWFFNGDTIPGMTNYYYVATQSGNYSVVCIDNNGCSVEAVILNVIASITPEILVSAGSGELIIFPNPVEATLHLEAKGLKGNKAIVTMKSMDAKVFMMREADIIHGVSLKTELQTEHLAAGVYFITIETDKEVWVERFTKTGW